MSEREPIKKLDKIDQGEKKATELDNDFVDLMGKVTRNIRNVGALVALDRLQAANPQLDWTDFPQPTDLETKLKEDRKKLHGLVDQAVENRANTLMVLHDAASERETLVQSVEEALGAETE